MSTNEPFTWTEEYYQFLDEQLKSGASRKMIAETFTLRYGRLFTKGSISGAVDRRWPNRSMKMRDTQPLMNSVGAGKGTIIRKRKKAATIAQTRAAPTLHHVSGCKWIDGDPMAGDYTVCGQPAALKPNGDAKPYCPHHCSIAYLKPNERRREAVASQGASQ